MICSLHNDSLPLPNTRTIAPWQQNDHTDGTIADCSFLYVGRKRAHLHSIYTNISCHGHQETSGDVIQDESEYLFWNSVTSEYACWTAYF